MQVESASLCGTDSHQYDGRITTPFPRVPGHDFSGRVESVGEGVDDGDRRHAGGGQAVAAVRGLPGVPRGQARSTARSKKLMGLWSDGCMTEKVAVPRVNLIPRPEGVEAWQASLLEPIAVGLNTVDRLRIVLGETVMVLGQGPIGLALTRLCALSGAGPADRHRRAGRAVRGLEGRTAPRTASNVTQTDVKRRSPTSPSAGRARTS